MKSVTKFAGKAIIIGAVGLCVFYIGLKMWGDWSDEWTGWNDSWMISDGYCNIAVVPVIGDITSYGEYADENGNPYTSTTMGETLSLLDTTLYDPYIEGVLVLVDSPGGEAAAAQLMSEELITTSLYMPVAAYIVEIGASAAYLVATGAERIFASPFSDVGSIGVTMSYLDYTKQNEAEGLEFVSLSSAKYKDYGTPDKPLTADERALLERDLKIYHDEFVKQVAGNRGMEIEKVAELADGSSMPSSLALEAGLIDEIGGKENVRNWFAEQLGLTSDEVVFCKN